MAFWGFLNAAYANLPKELPTNTYQDWQTDIEALEVPPLDATDLPSLPYVATQGYARLPIGVSTVRPAQNHVTPSESPVHGQDMRVVQRQRAAAHADIVSQEQMCYGLSLTDGDFASTPIFDPAALVRVCRSKRLRPHSYKHTLKVAQATYTACRNALTTDVFGGVAIPVFGIQGNMHSTDEQTAYKKRTQWRYFATGKAMMNISRFEITEPSICEATFDSGFLVDLAQLGSYEDYSERRVCSFLNLYGEVIARSHSYGAHKFFQSTQEYESEEACRGDQQHIGWQLQAGLNLAVGHVPTALRAGGGQESSEDKHENAATQSEVCSMVMDRDGGSSEHDNNFHECLSAFAAGPDLIAPTELSHFVRLDQLVEDYLLNSASAQYTERQRAYGYLKHYFEGTQPEQEQVTASPIVPVDDLRVHRPFLGKGSYVDDEGRLYRFDDNHPNFVDQVTRLKCKRPPVYDRYYTEEVLEEGGFLGFGRKVRTIEHPIYLRGVAVSDMGIHYIYYRDRWRVHRMTQHEKHETKAVAFEIYQHSRQTDDYGNRKIDGRMEKFYAPADRSFLRRESWEDLMIKWHAAFTVQD